MAYHQADFAAVAREGQTGETAGQTGEDPSSDRSVFIAETAQGALDPSRSGLLRRIELRLGSIT